MITTFDQPDFPNDHCQPCPTVQDSRHGHDPEAYQILLNKKWCQQIKDEGSKLWCPWRNSNCVSYPIEIDWALQHHNAGKQPPIKLADCFFEQEDLVA